MKAGIRLVELTCCYEPFIQYILHKAQINVFQSLFSMYYQQYMALSIRLMIFKAMYAILDSTTAVNYFLGNENEFNGYQTLIEMLQENQNGRQIIAIKSIIKKMNLYETFNIVKDTTLKVFDGTDELKLEQVDLKVMTESLSDIDKAFQDTFSFAQPRRFLPVSAQFSIPKDAFSFPFAMNGIKAYMQSNGFLEILIIIVSAKSKISTNLTALAYRLLENIIRNPLGLNYLIDNVEQTNILVRELFGLKDPDDVEAEVDPLSIYATKPRAIAMEIAYKIQTIFYLDAIMDTKHDSTLLMEHLQSLYTLCFNAGRNFVFETLCMDNNLLPLLTCIEMEKLNFKDGSPDVKNKSPVLIYAVDLLDCCVRNSNDISYLEEHSDTLLYLVKQHDLFEPSVSAMLQEMAVYLKPLEISNNVSHFEEIAPLVEQMKRSVEFITTYPGDLTMALRIIRHNSLSAFATTENNLDPDHVELKHKYFLLQFYSSDGMQVLMTILDKLNTYYMQPGMHTAGLATTQGLLLVQVLLPTIEIIRRMLTFVILARNVDFKDLTAIEPLLRTFALVNAIPDRGIAYNDAQKIETEIIRTLLAYTQPRATNGFDTANIHKSLWTLMIGELLKYVVTGPYCFIPGLSVFSELLPLPLPIPTKEPFDEKEVSQLITERQMWSAHLHSQSNAITEMIQTTCLSSNAEILIILCRVALQLSDLAPNMTLLVSKAISELIVNEPLGTIAQVILNFLIVSKQGKFL